jgi:hypothetical protein
MKKIYTKKLRRILNDKIHEIKVILRKDYSLKKDDNFDICIDKKQIILIGIKNTKIKITTNLTPEKFIYLYT